MMATRPSPALLSPTQAELDWFLKSGVDIMTLATPQPMQIAEGNLALDGLFESEPSGDRWLAFDEFAVDDVVFWQPRLGRFSTWSGRAFALGEDLIYAAATYAFDCNLNIFADPIDWLRAKRDGIVVIPDKWPLAFDRLRDAPRIAIAEALLPHYRRHMRPGHLPELFVLPDVRKAAS
jgi:hypothetical protein